MENDLSIQWVKRGDESRLHYLSQDGMSFSFDEGFLSETGKQVPAWMFITLNNQRQVGLRVRDRSHAEQIVLAFVEPGDKNQLLDNPDLIQ